MHGEKTAAVWFDAGSSRRQAAVVWMDGESLHVENDEGEVRCVPLAKVRLSARLANVPRQLRLPDGVMLSVSDNAFIDGAVSGARGGGGFVHAMEAGWRWLLFLLAAGAVVLYWLYAHGLPVAGDYAARLIPDEYIEEISETVYQNLNDILRPSRLSVEEKERAEQLFAAVADEYPQQSLQLRLHRFGGEINLANALAFPNGLIIITDGLMPLLTDDEISAVIAHEIGHVYHYHSQRALVQAAGISALFFLFGGDISGLSAVLLVLPNLKYSRDFEHEADCFAYQYIKRHNLSPTLIGTALTKLEQDLKELGDFDSSDAQEEEDEALEGDKLSVMLLEMLSTHPLTEKRANLQQHCE